MKVKEETMNQAIDLTKAAMAAAGPKWASNEALVIMFLRTMAKTIDDIKEDR
jgi:hypothetical protein